MQMITQGLTEIEYRCWQIIIPLMQESILIQKLIHLGYLAHQKYTPLPKSVKATIWAASGWSIGIVFGLISLALV